jgi:capsular polysaccharide biosynthesis protein
MEILDYFKAIGRRFWVLVLVPAIAGLLPLAYFVLRPTQYAARVTVIPTSLVGGVRSNQYRGSDADKFFANNVTGALRTNTLVNQVSQQTGVPAHAVRSGLSVKQANSSAFVDITYLTGKKKQAVPVVSAAAEDALHFLFQSQYDVAKAAVDAAQKQANQADDEINAISKQIGGQTPDVAYAAVSRGLPALQATAARTKDPSAAAQINQQVAAAQAQLTSIGKLEGPYLALLDVRRRAMNLRRDAEERQREASVQLAAAAPANALVIGKVHRSFPFSDALQYAVGGAAGGLFVAVGYLFGREVWDGLRRRSRPTAAAIPAAG